MKVNLQCVNFNVDKGLVEFVEKKLSALDKYYDKIVDAEVYLKVQQTSEKENKLIDVKLNVPGNDFVVKKQCKTFEEGILLAADSLKRQLAKKKEKVREK
ncbi:ribosome-associated translation inhibitor RaiA [Lutibacter sp. HS1-25]|uniref:ribosome hibernation-promoting factor, HPF/YfiA family n=1 Tax=Lutibacter sp. HS1-25 TaxID=2485000 RepID=UPI001010622B|nr:ribosome-associated translation inhibitor RaiA [Lutibacter sp. HS1-25]RXP63348.1 ribosome-associated translation inhibitor RaiA [Lutibacter sp. HS1-25]